MWNTYYKSKFFLRIVLRCSHAPINYKAWFNYGLCKLFLPVYRRFFPARFLPFYPVSATIWITSRCNLTCSFCHFSGELSLPNSEGNDFDFDAFVRLYRSQIFLQRTLRYALFGGEPLLHKDLSKFITFLKGHGHIVSVNTNGLLLRNCGEELVSDPPHFLCISYYKENAQILEHVLPDVTRSVPVRLNYVVFEHDFTETYKVMALARKCAVNLVTIDHYVPNGVSSHVPVTIENEGYARMKQDVLNAYMRQIAIDWREPLLQKRRTKCTFFWNSVFINEKGDFSGCCLWRRSSFRPLEESMWNGSYMRQLRQNMAINRPEVKCVTCRGLYDDTSAI